jgi:hypothetical protein
MAPPRDDVAVHGCWEEGGSGKAGKGACNRPRRRPLPQHRGGKGYDGGGWATPRPGGPSRGGSRRWWRSASVAKTNTPLLRSTHGPSVRGEASPLPADQASPMTAQGRPTLHHHHRAHRAPTPLARTPRTTPRLAFS